MRSNERSLIEIVSVLVLAGGLLLVAYQVNQATSITKAQISAEGTSRWRAVDGTRQSEVFATVLAKSYEDPAALTLADMIELDAYYMGVIDQMGSAYNMVNSGFRDGAIELDIEQAAVTYFGNAFAQAWWRQYKTLLVGQPTEFVKLFDNAVSAVSETQDQEKYDEIRKELGSGQSN